MSEPPSVVGGGGSLSGVLSSPPRRGACRATRIDELELRHRAVPRVFEAMREAVEIDREPGPLGPLEKQTVDSGDRACPAASRRGNELDLIIHSREAEAASAVS
jgi:hypothetical protein